MDKEDKDFLLGVADVAGSVAKAWFDYKNRPLDPLIRVKIEDLLKADPTEQNLKDIKAFEEVFSGRLPDDLDGILRLKEKQIKDLLEEKKRKEEEERRKKSNDGLDRIRNMTRDRMKRTIPDSNVFYCNPDGRVAKGDIDMK